MSIDHRELQEVFSGLESDVQAGQVIVEQNYGCQEQNVAHARCQECFLGSGSRRGLPVPETDQEIRTQSHQLPEYEELKQVIGIDQAQHGSGKQCRFGEVSGCARIAVHVSVGIGVNQCNHEGYHEKHHQRQRIYQYAYIEIGKPWHGLMDYLHLGYISENIPRDNIRPAKVARTVRKPPPLGSCLPTKRHSKKASTGSATIRYA